MVRAGFRTSCRLAASPTRIPSAVNATTEGRRTCPSASGMTLGKPPSMYATRLLVVPRSMPTMRDMGMGFLSEGFAQIVDDRGQIGAHGQDFLHAVEQLTPEVVSIARRAPPPVDGGPPPPAHVEQPLLLRPPPLRESRALVREALPRLRVEG